MKKRWRKGDLFTIDWAKLSSEDIPEDASSFIGRWKAETNDKILEVAGTNYQDSDDPFLYYKVDDDCYRMVSTRHAIPVRRKRK